MAIRIMDGEKATVTYAGAVLATRERNYHDDSDFYAIVWDEKAQRVTTVEYATTRFSTYGNDATVDATPDVAEKAAAWAEKWWLAQLKRAAVLEARQVAVGKEVRVVGGRKLPVGGRGQVFWAKEQVAYRYRNWARVPQYGYELRVGVQLADGTKGFTNAKNLKVVGARRYRRTLEEVKQQARARRDNWVTPVNGLGYPLPVL